MIIDIKKSFLRAYLDTICALSYEYLIKRKPSFIDSDIDNVQYTLAIPKLYEARLPRDARAVLFCYNNKNIYIFKYYKFDIYLFMGGAIIFFYF